MKQTLLEKTIKFELNEVQVEIEIDNWVIDEYKKGHVITARNTKNKSRLEICTDNCIGSFLSFKRTGINLHVNFGYIDADKLIDTTHEKIKPLVAQ